jgi:ATPase subunit of ABC transporter with duplicated ATPase domains
MGRHGRHDGIIDNVVIFASIDNLSCTHSVGETWQAKDVSSMPSQGANAALIVANGSGTSTLLRILAESTYSDDSLVDTTSEGMMYICTVASPRTLKLASAEHVHN